MKGLSLLVLIAFVLVGPVVGWAQTPPAGQPPAGSPPATSPAQPGGAGGTTTVPDSTTPKSPAPAPPGSTAPAAPGSSAPATPGSTAPATPGSSAPDTAAPRAQTPGTPATPGDRAADTDNRILGLSPLAATILGLVVLGLIVALMVGRRRDRDVIVESRVDAGVGPDRPLDTYESEIERERRRRAS
jgi:hypothetical protein